MADGKLLYRVLENLLSNISKYALEGSRVYIDVSKPQLQRFSAADEPDKLLLEVKNISRDELNISPDELMERFTRGDRSRNTEGSGLGLAIAKDLTNLMGGTFDITIDGDMFKASVLLNEA
jgi:signal transduction histidine kinase